MSSQEDYLDQLLSNIMDGGNEQQAVPADEEAQVISADETESSGIPELTDLNEMPEMPEGSELSEMSEMRELLGTPETSGMNELPEEPAVPEMNEIFDMPEASEGHGDSEDIGDILGTPVEDSDIEALLKSFEDSDEISEEAAPDSPETSDISSMSEEDIDRLLEESRGMPEDNADSQEEEFQGDVVDLLEGTEDSELQEIQDLLEKSDNNEAVGKEIEELLRGPVQDNQNAAGGFRAGADTDGIDGAEGQQLTPKQQKAAEKKRLKEEKAAAKKAEKEARKAEKAARKAAKKAGRDGIQEAEDALGSGASGRTAGDTGEPIDTAVLDSILSEAGKINGAETISSATGNYDAEFGNIIQDEGQDTANKNTSSNSSVNDDLGIDLNDLFGGSAEAESAMMAGGDESDFPGFVALDGDDVTGVIELAGEDEEESRPKKKGFFSRFLEFLTEEDEEEEENENIKLSEENQEIIEDLDKEKDKADKKGKKGKKKAKKAASVEDGEEGEEGEESSKGKKKKAKKPKKEKPPREAEPVDPRKKLSLKKVMPIVLICLSLVLAIVIVTYASVDFMDKKAAKDAYYEGDYQTCYQNLYGKDLDSTEQIMYGKSQSILTIRLWIRMYEMLSAEGARLEALDSLIQSVNDYPVLYEYAGQWNAAGEVAQEYATILNYLYENFGLTEEQARAIASEQDDIEYTRQVNAIAQGGAYGSWNEPEPVVEVPVQDELPEELELPAGNFIDTNALAQ